MEFTTKFYVKVSQMGISWQPLIRKHSYLGHDYFTHVEPSQSVVGAKTGDPREKPPDHPLAVLGVSHK